MSLAAAAQIAGNRRHRPAPDAFELTERGIAFYYADDTELRFYYPGTDIESVLWNFRAEAAEEL
jgi:hypothetical protein